MSIGPSLIPPSFPPFLLHAVNQPVSYLPFKIYVYSSGYEHTVRFTASPIARAADSKTRTCTYVRKKRRVSNRDP